MFRRAVFQAHWILGISLGAVLALMGVTGALLSFQDEIIDALSPSHVALVPRPLLPPDALAAALHAQEPEVRIGQILMHSDGIHAQTVRVRGGNGGDLIYLDPRNGHVLGGAVGSGFFSFVERLHRFLALPAGEGRRDSLIGRKVTGLAAFTLIFFALSGLYLRWPRRPLDWRSWLVMDIRRTGRNLYRTLHAVIGGWVLLFYLVSATSGLWWSYGWYHNAINAALGVNDGRGNRLFGHERPTGREQSRNAQDTDEMATRSSSTGISATVDRVRDSDQRDAHVPTRVASVLGDGGRGQAMPTGHDLPGRRPRGDHAGFVRPDRDDHEHGFEEPRWSDRPGDDRRGEFGDRLWRQFDHARGERGVLARGPGADRQTRGMGDDRAAGPSLNPGWSQFLTMIGRDYGVAAVSVARDDDRTVEIQRVQRGILRDGLTDHYYFDGSGKLLRVDLLGNRPLNQVIGTSMFALHSGALLGWPGRIAITVSSLTMPLFFITGWLLYLDRRRRKRAAVKGRLSYAGADTGDILVIYASQTGTAERIARTSAAALAAGGRAPRILPIADLDDEMLRESRLALFVVSTYCDGEAPDLARAFARRMRARGAGSEGLAYAVLALGDREYPDFCRFGRDVDAWMKAGGGRRIFDTLVMHGDDSVTEASWRNHLIDLGGIFASPNPKEPAFSPWTLVDRRQLNRGGVGGGVFHLRFKPCDETTAVWQAGDIVEIAARNDPTTIDHFLLGLGLDPARELAGQTLAEHLAGAELPDPEVIKTQRPERWLGQLRSLRREYSAASIPADGTLDLVVRQVVKDDGALGIGSGWLTAQVGIGEQVSIRLRRNIRFHRPDSSAPLILIGNGTGFAGLRAHLHEQRLLGVGGHWLLFGERNARYDAFFNDELEGMRAQGTLARIDLAYSRDPECGRYVQDLLKATIPDLRLWVDAGAIILVCGSQAGMAPAVDRVLRDTFGEGRIDFLIDAGRYRRDVY